MSELWRSKKAKDDDLLESLMETISVMVEASRTRELRSLQRELRELAQSIGELITQMQTQKAYGVKGQGVGEAMAEIRKRIASCSEDQGVVAGMARWIARH